MNNIKLLYIIYSKSAKITLSVGVVVGKFVCDVNGGKPVRSFFVYDERRPELYTILLFTPAFRVTCIGDIFVHLSGHAIFRQAM